MSGELLSVRSASELDAVLQARPGLRRPRGRVALEIPALGEAERGRWERLINRHYRACGCEAGAAMTVLSVVAYGVYLFLGGGLSARGPLKVVALGIAVVLAAAVIGKGLGLLYARLRLLGLVAALRRRLG